jgi:2-polyprenyl-3-methyl-5-hydroxy-6-metoxy-1,4-benzoquinol methylase
MATGVPSGNTYDKYATRNPIGRRLMRGFVAALDACLPAHPPLRILEIGAGEGEITQRVRERWPSAQTVALDLPSETLRAHWQSRALQGVNADAARLPFRGASFDLVLAIEVLEHVPSPPAVLAELARVAAGDVVLSVPREPLWRILNVARGAYVRDLGNTPGHLHHWGRWSFTTFVSGHLEIVRVATPTPWTMVAARVSHRPPRDRSQGAESALLLDCRRR